MPKLYLKFTLVTLMLIGSLFFTALTASAQTVHRESAPAASTKAVLLHSCEHLLVQLHGTDPATSSCLDKQIAATISSASYSNPIPNLGFVDCGSHSNSLILWIDSNFSGGTICFENAGSTDMTEWPCPGNHLPGCNWNDNASSYEARCSGGTFWSDVGEQGQRQPFNAHDQHNFDGLSGRLANDTLSSLTHNNKC
jgi:hypothetical protein